MWVLVFFWYEKMTKSQFPPELFGQMIVGGCHPLVLSDYYHVALINDSFIMRKGGFVGRTVISVGFAGSRTAYNIHHC